MKNHQNRLPDPGGCRQLTMGVPIDFFWRFFEKSRTKKNVFFEHETKTQKFDLASFSIRSSAYVAQFLDRLEHSECTNLFGDFFFRENVTKIPENASLQWDPHSKVTSPGGEHGGNKKHLARKK